MRVDGGREVAALGERAGEIEPGPRVIGRRLDHAAKTGDGLVEPPFPEQQGPQVVARGSHVRIRRQGTAIARRCRGGVAGVFLDVAEIGEEHRVGGIARQRAADEIPRLDEAPALVGDQPEQVQGVGMAWIAREQRLVFARRAREVAATVKCKSALEKAGCPRHEFPQIVSDGRGRDFAPNRTGARRGVSYTAGYHPPTRPALIVSHPGRSPPAQDRGSHVRSHSPRLLHRPCRHRDRRLRRFIGDELLHELQRPLVEPTESGWGANITQQADTMFVTLFVYGQNSSAVWYTATLVFTGESITGRSPSPVICTRPRDPGSGRRSTRPRWRTARSAR